MKKAFELSNRLFCSKPLFCSLVALLPLTIGCTVLKPGTATSAEQSTQPQRFAQWCQRGSTIPKATKHTVNVLLKIAKTNNCELADTRLRSQTYLNLGSSGVSDLKPLAGLTALAFLDLRNNRVSDLRPLAGLTTLETLLLDNNQIRDLYPLVNLKSIYFITLENNQISDLQPLASLNRLTTIRLNKNRISDVNSLATLTRVRELTLDDNQITDLRPLTALNSLEQLHIRKNPLSNKTCPIQRVNPDPILSALLSVCRFD